MVALWHTLVPREEQGAPGVQAPGGGVHTALAEGEAAVGGPVRPVEQGPQGTQLWGKAWKKEGPINTHQKLSK